MSTCTEKIKTEECLDRRDNGYQECNKWADEGSNKCGSWGKCKWYTPWNCIAGFFCRAYYWVANLVCKGYRWIENIVCVLWKYVKKISCYIIAGIKFIISGLLVLINFLASLPDFAATNLGYMAKKKLRLVVDIQRDAEDKLVVNDIEVVRRCIQYLINSFKSEMNIELIPAVVLNPNTNIAVRSNYLNQFIVIEEQKSDDETLDVCCDSCAFGAELGSVGWRFQDKMMALGVPIFAYANPIVAFAVRSYEDGKAGCSIGPFSSYVTVKFNEEANSKELNILELTADKLLDSVTTLAHEVAHSCMLPHLNDNNNLMNPSPPRSGKLTICKKHLFVLVVT